MTRRHWSKMPPVPGFTRVPDDEYRPGQFRRMIRCDACGEVIPSLGVGYHHQGRPCTERAAARNPLLTPAPEREHDVSVTTTTKIIDNDTHPFRLGRMVYQTLAAAETAKAKAREIYPNEAMWIIDRRTGKVVG